MAAVGDRCAPGSCEGDPSVLADLIAAGGRLPAGGPTFDPDDPEFLPPGDMPARIAARLRRRRPAACRDTGASSSAASWTASPSPSPPGSPTPNASPGTASTSIHIVGGGSQNALLCQLVADAADLPVVAGPVEATALGNLLVQARTHGALTGDRWALRAELRKAVHTRTFRPGDDPAGT